MQVFKFLSGGAFPRTPLKSFLVFKLLKIKSAEKITLEKVTKFGAPSLKKILNTPLDMKHFEKAYLRSFPGLNVSAFS